MDALKFCIITFSAIFLFATAPAFFSFYYDFSTNIEPAFNNYLFQLDYIQSNSYVSLSSLLVFIAVPFYTLVMPFFPKKFNRVTLFKKSFLYFFYTFVFNYLVLLIPLMYLISFGYFSEEFLTKITIYWLSVPGVFVALIPTFLVMFLLVFLFDTHKVKGDKCDLIPSQIMYELVSLLKDINKYEQRNVNANTKKKLTSRIDEISFLIRSMPSFMKRNCAVEKHMDKRFTVAAKAIKSLKLCVLLPEGNSRKTLKRKVESLFNIFATGNYMDLPNSPYIPYRFEEPKKHESTIKRFITLLSFATFFISPLILWSVFISQYNPKIPMSIQSILPVLYSVWCLIGLLSFSEKLAPDAKVMVFDVFKLLLTKK